MECPNCRHDSPAGKKFCIYCGASLPAACAACGSVNPPHARFCGDCGASFSSVAPRGSSSSSTAPSATAERRQITAMFCDLVGSTELANRLDPEDLRDVIAPYQRCCAEAIERCGGFVARYMGDGLLAYFGYPQAHEDDAVQAVQAGLSAVDSVAGLHNGIGGRLQVRVGIATGLVVVGDMIGEGISQEQQVAGETPNLAARLQAVAEPGQVVIAPATRRLTAGHFDYRDLGTFPLKGFSEPVGAWQVLGARAVASRFEAHHMVSLSRLVGRDDELNCLSSLWRQARDGDGCMVTVIGEPGIGKSHLIAALQERVAAEPHQRLRYFCSPRHTDSAWFPIIAQIERAARFERGDLPGQKLEKLELLLRRAGLDAPATIPILIDLLSLPTDKRGDPAGLTPQERKGRTMTVLLAQYEALAAGQPLLLIFEDVQWIDPTSMELLGRIIEQLPKMRCLLLVTTRPEFVPPWPDRPYGSTISLRRLGRREAAAVVEQVAGGKSLPDDLMTQIFVRTEGVPLFVEELTKTLLESGELRERNGHYVLAGALPTLAIPPTIQDSIMARLDRLAPVKEVAQVGAALGRSFSYAMLTTVISQTGAELRAALARLVEAEIILSRGEPPDAVYTFKHALVQDAAYETMLRSTRHVLHRRIVHALETHFPEVADTEPEVLAHHCTRAELREKGVDYWLKAGQRAVARSANLEAINHLRNGLDLLAALPPSEARSRQELNLQLALAHACIAVYGYTGEATTRAYARAGELITVVGDLHQRIGALFGMYIGHLMGGKLVQGEAPVRQVIELAEREADAGYKCLGYRIDGVLSLYRGDFVRARQNLEKGIELYDRDLHRDLMFRFGSDLGISAQAWLVVTLWLLGLPDSARRLADDTIVAARATGHIHTIGHVLGLVSHVYSETQDYPALADMGRGGVEFCEKHHLRFFGAWIGIMRLWAEAQLGEPAEHVGPMRAALEAYMRTNTMLMRGYFRGLLAQLLLAARQLPEAESEVAAALHDIAATGECWWEAEIHRIHGDICLARREVHAAEAAFRRAFDLARGQHARPLELRAGVSLARLLVDQGRPAEARHLLDPLCRQFEEGADSVDLRAARQIVERLAEPA